MENTRKIIMMADVPLTAIPQKVRDKHNLREEYHIAYTEEGNNTSFELIPLTADGKPLNKPSKTDGKLTTTKPANKPVSKVARQAGIKQHGLYGSPERVSNKPTSGHFGANTLASFMAELLPTNLDISTGENKPGYGFTIKAIETVYNKAGKPVSKVVERFFISSGKWSERYEGFGIGKPQLANMQEILGGNFAEQFISQSVQQGNKNYWYNADFGLIHTYLMRKYSK